MLTAIVCFINCIVYYCNAYNYYYHRTSFFHIFYIYSHHITSHNFLNQFCQIRCEIIILAPVAMIIAVRASLLASQRVEDITQYMSRTQNFNMKNLTEKLSKLLNTTDSKHLTGNVRTYILFLFLFFLL